MNFIYEYCLHYPLRFFSFNIFATVVHKNLKMAKQQTEVFDIFWIRNILLSFIFDDTSQQTDINSESPLIFAADPGLMHLLARQR